MKNPILTLVLFACLNLPAWAQPRPSTTLVAPPALSKELLEQLRSIRDGALTSDYAGTSSLT